MDYQTGDYSVAYIRPANMLLCLRNELNAVFPKRYTGTDGFVSGYDGPSNQTHGASGHNPNNLGHCMAFDFSTTVGMDIDEPTGRALTDYLRLKKNDFFKYLIHDMGPVEAWPVIASENTEYKWTGYTGPQHADHTHLSLTWDYRWGRPCGLDQSIYDRTVYWGIKEWYESYKSGGSKPQGGIDYKIEEDDLMATKEQRALLIQELLDTSVIKAGGGKTSLRSVLAHYDANLKKLPEEIVSLEFPKQGFNEKNVRFVDLDPAPRTSIKSELGWHDAGNISIRKKIDEVKPK